MSNTLITYHGSILVLILCRKTLSSGRFRNLTHQQPVGGRAETQAHVCVTVTSSLSELNAHVSLTDNGERELSVTVHM